MKVAQYARKPCASLAAAVPAADMIHATLRTSEYPNKNLFASTFCVQPLAFSATAGLPYILARGNLTQNSCPIGEYLSNNNCVPCPNGQTSPGTVLPSAMCQTPERNSVRECAEVCFLCQCVMNNTTLALLQPAA